MGAGSKKIDAQVPSLETDSFSLDGSVMCVYILSLQKVLCSLSQSVPSPPRQSLFRHFNGLVLPLLEFHIHVVIQYALLCLASLTQHAF